MSQLSCSVVSWMQTGSALFAFLAAAFWLKASLVKMPSTDIGEMPLSDLGRISKSFGTQSRWNAAAALCAAVAALLQGFLVYAPTCLNLG